MNQVKATLIQGVPQNEGQRPSVATTFFVVVVVIIIIIIIIIM
jgi:hypothetical protein